jgi:hypothetical protein
MTKCTINETHKGEGVHRRVHSEALPIVSSSRAHSRGGGAVTPPLPLQVPFASSYSLAQRGGGGYTDREMSRGDLRGIGESIRGGAGKKNPLSIGNIIEDETR